MVLNWRLVDSQVYVGHETSYMGTNGEKDVYDVFFQNQILFTGLCNLR